MTDLNFFSINQGTLPWQPISRKIGIFYGTIYFVALPFGKGLQYRNSDFKRLNRMNISTSCTILVTFGPETSEFTLLTIAPFVAIRQKSAYHAKYLRMFLTYLDLLYRFGRHISGMIFQVFVWRLPKGRCYGNQLNIGDVCKRRVGPPLLFASAFDNGSADHKLFFLISTVYCVVFCCMYDFLLPLCGEIKITINLLSKDSMAIIRLQYVQIR